VANLSDRSSDNPRVNRGGEFYFAQRNPVRHAPTMPCLIAKWMSSALPIDKQSENLALPQSQCRDLTLPAGGPCLGACRLTFATWPEVVLLGHERQNADDCAAHHEESRVDFVLQQNKQNTNGDCRGFRSRDCAFRHRKAAGEEEPDRHRCKSLLNGSSPGPFLEPLPQTGNNKESCLNIGHWAYVA
jgi:hypothetical protein